MAAAALAAMTIAACNPGASAGVAECSPDETEIGGACYRYLWESVAATAAESTCDRFGGELAAVHSAQDVGAILSMTQGRSSWIGCGGLADCESQSAEFCPYLDEGGAILFQSCYPQRDLSNYPRAYVCNVGTP